MIDMHLKEKTLLPQPTGLLHLSTRKPNAIKLEPQDQSFEGGGKASMEEEHRAQDAAGAAIS